MTGYIQRASHLATQAAQTLRTIGAFAIQFLPNSVLRWSIDATGNLVQSTATFLEMLEMVDPANPAANSARIYVKDNGAGKTQVVARFPTGAAVVIATEV